MKKFVTPLLVRLIMVIGILAIINPSLKQPYQLFDKAEAKLAHNYFIFPSMNSIMGTPQLIIENIVCTGNISV